MRLEYVCTNCGYVASKWYGKCPQCAEWNSFVEQEETAEPTKKAKRNNINNNLTTNQPKARRIKEISYLEKERTSTGIGEFDRVLGGGIVSGSVVLLSGEPGIGKSTLLLQICNQHHKLNYIQHL